MTCHSLNGASSWSGSAVAYANFWAPVSPADAVFAREADLHLLVTRHEFGDEVSAFRNNHLTSMNWARLSIDGRTVFGTVEGDRLIVHEGDMFGASAPTGQIAPLSDARWLPPCQPSKFIALWNNLAAAADKNGWARPSGPLYFIKTANAYNAHEQPIPAPPPSAGRVVYEGELGVVIGRRTKSVSAGEAVASIFGYTCVNDVTAFEVIHGDPSFEQWTRAKSYDGFAPFGPVIATGVDPTTLIVRTLMNGRERQNYPVADMFFSPAEIVSHISQDLTLEPGDVIACGTTTVGIAPMRPGVVVEVAIEGIGVLRNVFGDQEAPP